MKKNIFIVVSFFLTKVAMCQTISGNLVELSNQYIALEGFDGLKIHKIDSVKVSEKGNFNLKYTISDYGLGYLKTTDKIVQLVILNGDNIKFEGKSLYKNEDFVIIKSKENQLLKRYIQESPIRENALSAWTYLENVYKTDTVFSKQLALVQNIVSEKQRINNEEISFLSKLPKNSFIEWFLPIHKLVKSAAKVAQYLPEEIPATITAFRNIDYNDNRLYKSGLYKEAIENHFWLLENSGKPLDKVFEEMEVSIDSMLVYLVKDEIKYNEVTKFLFDLLEKHSLFKASEYLALKVLNDNKCTIDNKLAHQLETYRVMKNGNIAPDIVFEQNFFADQSKSIKSLSSLKNKYTVIVFGASWCPRCTEELPEISKLYDKWKSNDVEVIFIGLEEDKKSFLDFTQSFPFPSYSDFTKWKSKIANDYHVYTTPSIFLLDSERKIIIRPNSVKHMDAWVDWFIVKNK